MKETVQTRIAKPDRDRVEWFEEKWEMTTAGVVRRLMQTGLRVHEAQLASEKESHSIVMSPSSYPVVDAATEPSETDTHE